MERKRVKITEPQKNTMICFLRNNPKMLNCQLNRESAMRSWMDLRKILHQYEGPRKTWEQWRKVWRDIRTLTKAKYLYVVKHYTNDKLRETLTAFSMFGENDKIIRETLGIKPKGQQGLPAKSSRKVQRTILRKVVKPKHETPLVHVKQEPYTENDDYQQDAEAESDPFATLDYNYDHTITFCDTHPNAELPERSQMEFENNVKEESSHECSTDKGVDALVKMGQDLMEYFRQKSKEDELFRQEQLRLMRVQTEAIQSIANSLEKMKK